jgi:hypothetical protein
MHDRPDIRPGKIFFFHIEIVREQPDDIRMTFEETGRRPRDNRAIADSDLSAMRVISTPGGRVSSTFSPRPGALAPA